MKKFFKDLINSLTIQNLLSKPKVDLDFKFDKTGWYFFISPVSGILKIKIIRPENIGDTDLTRFLKWQLLVIIGCDSPFDFSTLYNFALLNLDILNELQTQSINTIWKSKVHIYEPGIYKLKLLQNTISFTNDDPYYLFDAIDAGILNFYLDKLNSTIKNVDDYLNDPFYYFMYDLDGFMIYEKYVDDKLKVGQTYECKVDYISRNSSFSRQLAIKKIYLYLKIDNI